jgi:hypothetical protein
LMLACLGATADGRGNCNGDGKTQAASHGEGHVRNLLKLPVQHIAPAPALRAPIEAPICRPRLAAQVGITAI